MIEIAAARQMVLAETAPLAPRKFPAADALGLVLAEEVESTIDSPPHHKAMMDGYALIAADLKGGRAELTVIEEVAAGAVPTKAVASGQATRIMTGAPVPEGTDCVVMVERTELIPNAGGSETVRIDDASLASGANVMLRGTCLQQGQALLKPGHEIRGIEIGLLAEIGKTELLATPRPRAALLSTGDELVPATETPAAGQIRNSNSPMLTALARSAGAEPVDLGIARDNEADLRAKIAEGLRSDCLLLSGGVSAGKFDLTPRVLADLGVEQVFHKVHLKPGKPLWFGVLRGEERRTQVFGLPGNPVSSVVCFELFARPALRALAGFVADDLRSVTAELAAKLSYNSGRPVYHPARLDMTGGRAAVEILPWHGSADMLTVCLANCLAYLPAGEHALAEGTLVEVLRF